MISVRMSFAAERDPLALGIGEGGGGGGDNEDVFIWLLVRIRAIGEKREGSEVFWRFRLLERDTFVVCFFTFNWFVFNF